MNYCNFIHRNVICDLFTHLVVLQKTLKAPVNASPVSAPVAAVVSTAPTETPTVTQPPNTAQVDLLGLGIMMMMFILSVMIVLR